MACLDKGDESWITIATVLVLGMIPALGFFEAGLLRQGATSLLLTQIFAGFVINCFLWFVVGFSLVYGTSAGGVIGDPSDYFLFLHVTDPSVCLDGQTISALSFATFEMMFAAITPLLITGAYAERMPLLAFLAINTLWEVLVYYPVAHWLWGFRGAGGWLYHMGALDFAGGIVIHVTAGASALVLSHGLGPRADQTPGNSSLPLVAVGGALLWMGWFGFNAGSALGAGPLAALVVANTQVASVASAMVWTGLEWRHGTPDVTHLINGGIAGLAGITPAAGYVSVQAACLLGLVCGAASHVSMGLIRHKLHIDDALDVSSVHGVTGLLGALVIGLAADDSVNPALTDTGLAVGGGGKLLGVQVLACLVAGLYSAAVCVVLLKCTQKLRRHLGAPVLPPPSLNGEHTPLINAS